jgi:hypothetical protein
LLGDALGGILTKYGGDKWKKVTPHDLSIEIHEILDKYKDKLKGRAVYMLGMGLVSSVAESATTEEALMKISELMLSVG